MWQEVGADHGGEETGRRRVPQEVPREPPAPGGSPSVRWILEELKKVGLGQRDRPRPGRDNHASQCAPTLPLHPSGGWGGGGHLALSLVVEALHRRLVLRSDNAASLFCGAPSPPRDTVADFRLKEARGTSPDLAELADSLLGDGVLGDRSGGGVVGIAPRWHALSTPTLLRGHMAIGRIAGLRPRGCSAFALDVNTNSASPTSRQTDT